MGIYNLVLFSFLFGQYASFLLNNPLSRFSTSLAIATKVDVNALKTFVNELKNDPDLLFDPDLSFLRTALAQYGDLKPILHASEVKMEAHLLKKGSLEELCQISHDACVAVTPMLKGMIDKLYHQPGFSLLLKSEIFI